MRFAREPRMPARRAWRSATAALLLAGLLPGLVEAIPIPGRGSWETTLEARDIDGDGVVDAYYDSSLDVSWLADADAGAGSSFDDGLSPVDGRMSWASANAWAAALEVQGLGGWRLPTLLGGTTTVSEISRLYYETLGNFGPGNPLTMTPPGSWGFENTADFVGVMSQAYWLDVLADPAAGEATSWFGDPISAYHSDEPVASQFLAWPVREGDVPQIPEPRTAALLLCGLAAVALGARRRAQSPASTRRCAATLRDSAPRL